MKKAWGYSSLNMDQLALSRSCGVSLFFNLIDPANIIARGEDELLAVRKGRGALTGFVNFMAREDAAKALNELDGLDWGGNQIRVAWGKPMPLPIEPIYGQLCQIFSLNK